jgi:hypothetical protein
MTVTEVLEYIIAATIVFILAFVFFHEPEPQVYIPDPPNFDQFEDWPIVAWFENDRRGPTVKIRYRIEKQNTRIWIYDSETDELVHKQPFSRDPNLDGTSKDFTYVWKLYKSERTIDIDFGIYNIIVGGDMEPTKLHGGYSTMIIL